MYHSKIRHFRLSVPISRCSWKDLQKIQLYTIDKIEIVFNDVKCTCKLMNCVDSKLLFICHYLKVAVQCNSAKSLVQLYTTETCHFSGKKYKIRRISDWWISTSMTSKRNDLPQNDKRKLVLRLTASSSNHFRLF